MKMKTATTLTLSLSLLLGGAFLLVADSTGPMPECSGVTDYSETKPFILSCEDPSTGDVYDYEGIVDITVLEDEDEQLEGYHQRWYFESFSTAMTAHMNSHHEQVDFTVTGIHNDGWDCQDRSDALAHPSMILFNLSIAEALDDGSEGWLAECEGYDLLEGGQQSLECNDTGIRQAVNELSEPETQANQSNNSEADHSNNEDLSCVLTIGE